MMTSRTFARALAIGLFSIAVTFALIGALFQMSLGQRSARTSMSAAPEYVPEFSPDAGRLPARYL